MFGLTPFQVSLNLPPKINGRNWRRSGNRAGATAPGPREVDLSANATMIFGEDDWDDLHRAVEEARMMLEKKS